MKTPLFLLFFFAVFCACKKEKTTNPDVQRAKTFLNAFVTTIQENSAFQKNKDWVAFRKDVLATVDDYNGYMGNIQKGIQKSLDLLGDKHSSFVFSSGQEIWGLPLASCSDEPPAVMPADSNIGYVKVGAFNSADAAKTEAYVADIFKQLQKADKPTLKGWIIDLRSNSGGFYRPMFRGVASFFNAGVVMHFLHPNNFAEEVALEDSMIAQAWHLYHPAIKLAVLTSHTTASAGEAITIMFKGLPNARSFGKNTCGLSTGKSSFSFGYDGELRLASSLMADKNKRAFGGEIIPDEPASTSLEAFNKAVEWIKQ